MKRMRRDSARPSIWSEILRTHLMWSKILLAVLHMERNSVDLFPFGARDSANSARRSEILRNRCHMERNSASTLLYGARPRELCLKWWDILRNHFLLKCEIPPALTYKAESCQLFHVQRNCANPLIWNDIMRALLRSEDQARP